MPPRRDAFTQRMPMGSIIKVHVAYETPFWRAKGLSGAILSDRTVTGLWMDHSIPGVETGGMVGFFAGGHAQAWAERSPEERRARAIEDPVTYLGNVGYYDGAIQSGERVAGEIVKYLKP